MERIVQANLHDGTNQSYGMCEKIKTPRKTPLTFTLIGR